MRPLPNGLGSVHMSSAYAEHQAVDPDVVKESELYMLTLPSVETMHPLRWYRVLRDRGDYMRSLYPSLHHHSLHRPSITATSVSSSFGRNEHAKSTMCALEEKWRGLAGGSQPPCEHRLTTTPAFCRHSLRRFATASRDNHKRMALDRGLLDRHGANRRDHVNDQAERINWSCLQSASW